MNSQKDKTQVTAPGEDHGVSGQTDRGPGLTRRRLVMRSAAVVPAILTLHSGAALARSSNLVSTVTDIVDGQPDVYHCLDTGSVEQVGANLYDLGESGQGQVTNIRADRTYYDAGGNAVSPAQMCQEGGTYYTEVAAEGASLTTKDASAEPDFLRQSFIPMQTTGDSVSVPRGGLVSATAFASIVSRANINIREI